VRSILLLLSITWVSGIVAGVAGNAGWWFMGAGVVVAVLTIKNKQGWPLVTVMLALIALGWGYGWLASHKVVSSCEGVEGKVAEVVSRPEYLEKQLRFVTRVDDCQILVSSSPWLTISQKDQAVISNGRIQSLEEVKDFSIGYADYLRRRGIGATWFFPDVEIVKVNSLGGWSQATETQILSNVLRRRIQTLFIEPDASLVLGMLLAQKGTIPEEITQQFQATSVSHVLAISGMNVSIIAGIIYFILSWLPMRKSWQTALMLLVLWLYIAFIGAPVSVVRAGSFISVVVILLRLSKLVSLPTALVTTVVVYATVDPLVMLDVGWQLSVSAVIGIFLILFVTKQIQPRLNKGGIGIWLYNGLIVSVGASLATWPLIMYYFGNVSLVSLLANMLVVPVVPIILVFAPASIALSWFWMGGGLILSLVTHWSISWLLGVTEVLSQWPGMYWQEMTIPVWAMVVYFAAILGLAHYVLRRQNRSWREVWA
jgi:competence protein ComEC